MCRNLEDYSPQCVINRLRLALLAVERERNSRFSGDPIGNQRAAIRQFQTLYPGREPWNSIHYNRDRAYFARYLEETARDIGANQLHRMEKIIRYYRDRYLDDSGADAARHQLALSIRAWLPFVSYAPFHVFSDTIAGDCQPDPPRNPLPPEQPPPPTLSPEASMPAPQGRYVESGAGLTQSERQRLIEEAERRRQEQAEMRTYVQWRDVTGNLPEGNPRALAMHCCRVRTSGQLRKILYDRDPVLVLLPSVIREPRQLLEIIRRPPERRSELLRIAIDSATSVLQNAYSHFHWDIQTAGNIQWQRYRPITAAAKQHLLPDNDPRHSSQIELYTDEVIRSLEPETPQNSIQTYAMIVSIAAGVVTAGVALPVVGAVAFGITLATDVISTSVVTYLNYLENQRVRQINQFGHVDAALEVASPEMNLTTEALFMAASYLVPWVFGATVRNMSRTQLFQRIAARVLRRPQSGSGAANMAEAANRGLPTTPQSGQVDAQASRLADDAAVGEVQQGIAQGSHTPPTPSPAGQVAPPPAGGAEVATGGGPPRGPAARPAAEATEGVPPRPPEPPPDEPPVRPPEPPLDQPPPRRQGPSEPPPEPPPRPVEPPDARTGVDETPASRSLDVPEVPSSRLRPPPGYSEQYVHQYLQRSFPSGTWEEQIVFLNGRRWTGQPGARLPRNSTRPESYNELLGIAVEVKNWDQAMNYHEMIRNIMGQQGGRAISLPPGTRQWLFVDVRMQRLTDFDGMARSIRRDLGGTQIFERIHLITDGGVLTYR